MVEPSDGPTHRSRPRAELNSTQRRKLSRRERTSFASISRTATTPSICSRRSAIPKMESLPTTTSRGNCRPTIICRPIPTADARSAMPRSLCSTDPPHVAGHVTGTGPIYLLKDTGQESFLAARYRLANFEIQIAEHEFESGGEKFPAGSWILLRSAGPARRDCNPPPKNSASTSPKSRPLPDVPHHPAPAPRIGVWVPWADTDSIGWIRYSLDQRKVPYTYLRDEDIRAGNLRSTDRRPSIWPRRSRTRRADRRPAENLVAHAVQENAADAQLRHARRIRRHHRWHRLRRSRADSALHRRWRPDGHARQRQHAARSKVDWCALFAALREAFRAARPEAVVSSSAAAQQAAHPHSGRARACHLRSP